MQLHEAKSKVSNRKITLSADPTEPNSGFHQVPDVQDDSVKSIGTIRVDVSPKADYDFSPGKGRMPNDNRIFFTDKSRSAIPITYSWDFKDLKVRFKF